MVSSFFGTNRNNYNGGVNNGNRPYTTASGGGVQIKLTDEEIVASFAASGTFNGTYYSTPQMMFKTLQTALSRVSPEFAAKAAVYARRNAKMKDVPAYILVALADMDKEFFNRAFDLACLNGKDITNFAQIVRSGHTGHTSIGSTKRKALQRWFNSASTEKVLNASIGGSGSDKFSLSDVIRFAHIKAKEEHQELFRWVMGYKDLNMAALPEQVANYIDFKSDPTRNVAALPKVPFLMFNGLQMSKENHLKLLDLMTFNQLRQSLVAMIRKHGYSPEIGQAIEQKFTPENVRNSGMLPHAMLGTYKTLHASEFNIPRSVMRKLEEAFEASLDNAPVLPGKPAVYIDTSGSMGCSTSGRYGVQASDITMAEAAAAFAYSVIQKNPNIDVYFFDTSIVKARANGSFFEFANRAKMRCGGGTWIKLAFENFGQNGYDSGIIISDNECNHGIYSYGHSFNKMKGKIAMWDIQAGRSSNIVDGKKSMYVSGLNDSVFELLTGFFDQDRETVSLVDKIKAIQL